MVHVRFINDQETVVTVPVRPDVDRCVLAVMPVKIKLELLRDTLGVNGGRDTDAAFTRHEQDRILFRQWANKVLKDYLLKGYSINKRLSELERTVAQHTEKIDFFVRTALPPVEGIFYNGQIFDAYKLFGNPEQLNFPLILSDHICFLYARLYLLCWIEKDPQFAPVSAKRFHLPASLPT